MSSGLSVGGVSPGIWGQFCRVPGSSFTDGRHGVQILSLPSPVSATAAALGLGPLSAATAVCPSPQPPGGRGGGWRWPAVPEAPLKRAHVCLGVRACGQGGGFRGKTELASLLEQKLWFVGERRAGWQADCPLGWHLTFPEKQLRVPAGSASGDGGTREDKGQSDAFLAL